MENEILKIRSCIKKEPIPDFILGLSGIDEKSMFIISNIKEDLLELINIKVLSNKKLNQIYESVAERFDTLFDSITIEEGSIIWVYIYNLLCELEKITVAEELFESSSNLNKFIRISFDIDIDG
jgi:hypothetical protein